MGIGRRDDWLTDAQGRALAGATVYYCNQPATTSSLPPSPLATIYSNIGGTVPEANPQTTDGFGHSVAYGNDSVLYTIVYVHPLFGPNPIVLPDQSFGGGGSGVGYRVFQEVPAGAIDGTNRVFTLSVTPVQATVWLNFPLIDGLGYTLSGNTITYAVAPQPAGGGLPTADSLYAQGLY